MPGERCPICGSNRAGNFRFCRKCQFDYEPETGAVLSAASSGPELPASTVAAGADPRPTAGDAPGASLGTQRGGAVAVMAPPRPAQVAASPMAPAEAVPVWPAPPPPERAWPPPGSPVPADSPAWPAGSIVAPAPRPGPAWPTPSVLTSAPLSAGIAAPAPEELPALAPSVRAKSDLDQVARIVALLVLTVVVLAAIGFSAMSLYLNATSSPSVPGGGVAPSSRAAPLK